MRTGPENTPGYRNVINTKEVLGYFVVRKKL